MYVVATAGHVDHGKSTLVRVLTGTDPDRLAEEQARKLTIDLGFAWMLLPSGRELSFVDVPGHVRFTKNMLAGVGALEACLFVVSAIEGWKPQSEEHLSILDLLGVNHGVVALTHARSADPDLVELARLEVEERISASRLAGADIVGVDAPVGAGLDELVGALDKMVGSMPAPLERGRPRLWIDRCFSVKGAGVVVTGTLTGGQIRVGDRLAITPGTPPDREPISVRVRRLESHGRPLDVGLPGSRVAVNLAPIAGVTPSGFPGDGLARGHALVSESQWAAVTTMDATATILAGAPSPLRSGGAYHVHIGSGEYPAHVRVLGREEVLAGTDGLVRLRLPVALPLVPGDRYVLRDVGRSQTVGGGEVLDVAPLRRASRARPSRSVKDVVAEHGWIEVDLLERLSGERVEANVAGRFVVDSALLAALEERLAQAVRTAGPIGLDTARLDSRDRVVLERLVGRGEIALTEGRARPAGAPPALEAAAAHPYVRALDAEPFGPPQPRDFGIDGRELQHLLRVGVVRESEGLCFSADAVRRAVQIVTDLASTCPEGVTVSQVRDALGSSRKFVLSLLALLDADGVTNRVGDHRLVAGLETFAAGALRDEEAS